MVTYTVIAVFFAIAAWIIWRLFKPTPVDLSRPMAYLQVEFNDLEHARLITKNKLIGARLTYLKLRTELADIEARQSGIASQLGKSTTGNE